MNAMTDAFERVLARYALRMKDEAALWASAVPGALMPRRDEFLLSVGEEVARFLHALVIARAAVNILELGTSYGYSTLFLAAAAQKTGGKVHTLELSPEKQSHARMQLSDAGVADSVEWHCGDALAIIPALANDIDFVLVDLWKDMYVPCLELFFPKLASNAVIAADNMLYPDQSLPEAATYRAAVKTKPGIQTVLLPIGSGIELSCLWQN
jgi:predicted O-methyltransferase YrrM